MYELGLGDGRMATKQGNGASHAFFPLEVSPTITSPGYNSPPVTSPQATTVALSPFPIAPHQGTYRPVPPTASHAPPVSGGCFAPASTRPRPRPLESVTTDPNAHPAIKLSAAAYQLTAGRLAVTPAAVQSMGAHAVTTVASKLRITPSQLLMAAGVTSVAARRSGLHH